MGLQWKPPPCHPCSWVSPPRTPLDSLPPRGRFLGPAPLPSRPLENPPCSLSCHREAACTWLNPLAPHPAPLLLNRTEKEPADQDLSSGPWDPRPNGPQGFRGWREVREFPGLRAEGARLGRSGTWHPRTASTWPHVLPSHITKHRDVGLQSSSFQPSNPLGLSPKDPFPLDPQSPSPRPPRVTFLPPSQVSCSTTSTQPPSLPWKDSSRVWRSSCSSSTSCEAGPWARRGNGRGGGWGERGEGAGRGRQGKGGTEEMGARRDEIMMGEVRGEKERGPVMS